MGIAYLKFSDEAEVGHVEISGVVEGQFDPNSASHITVLRLQQAVAALNTFLMSLPPAQIQFDNGGLQSSDAVATPALPGSVAESVASNEPIDTPSVAEPTAVVAPEATIESTNT